MKMIVTLWKGSLKWYTLTTLLALVSVATVLQTYSTLDISTSISASYVSRYSDVMQNSSTTSKGIPLRETVEMTADHIQENENPGRVVLNYKASDFNNIRMSPGFNMSTNSAKLKISHIGFLKVHKAGSTTMQNIFFRFGLKYSLTFVLPEKGHYFLSTKTAMPVKPGNHRDILACHSVYSRKLFGSVLPADSVNIGIIREPLERMISAAYYYRDVWKSPLLVKVPRANFIHNLVNRPDLYEKLQFTKTKNAIGKDFGFPSGITIKDTEFIKKHLDLLKNDFKQVLVMERFDESLILMKRTLNWDLLDIIYLKTNSHAHQQVVLSPSELKKFKSTCFLDYAVYDTFYEIFDEKVIAEGQGFVEEVKHFQVVLGVIKDFCDIVFSKQFKNNLTVNQSMWNKSFNVTALDCTYMQMKELKFVDFLKKRHKTMNMA